ncbi:two-component system phosphate regulon response regulator OmpR [Tahibacter aquaticus]|uniref:Two-component system phosphate regulon response regulator OmpR n=1 Tax=Tahibacter aquaticus TaxID=520092 RepID=A0A4R6YTC4_9GAMM|nr:response regulator [Tahibacter aquaticus]TDR41581.1 two-component system phosphate regulon response regulator OmpR [Tahibacter aquaticus]
MEAKIPHILCVDDEEEIRVLLSRYLGQHGMRISLAASGSEMRRFVAEGGVDLVLLDLGLPGDDGLSLMRHLREQWNGAVIIVSGRSDAVDRIVGLELGADDYVTKPFDLRELLARVRSVLRRLEAGRAAAPAIDQPRRVAVFAGLRFDLAARTLHDRAGTCIDLTSGEFELLRAFVQQPNQVLSRDTLMNCIHGREAGPYDRAIDMQIGRLRRKIEADPERPALIKSVRGAGYMFVPAVEHQP